MAVTRSMYGTSQRDKVTSDKITAQRDDETRESYQAPMSEFNSLNDSEFCNDVPVRASRLLPRPSDLPKPRRNKLFEDDIWSEAMFIFMKALREEHLKNDPNFRFNTREPYYGAGVNEFRSLNDATELPILARL